MHQPKEANLDFIPRQRCALLITHSFVEQFKTVRSYKIYAINTNITPIKF